VNTRHLKKITSSPKMSSMKHLGLKGLRSNNKEEVVKESNVRRIIVNIYIYIYIMNINWVLYFLKNYFGVYIYIYDYDYIKVNNR
jgi:hypothetical protein